MSADLESLKQTVSIQNLITKSNLPFTAEDRQYCPTCDSTCSHSKSLKLYPNFFKCFRCGIKGNIFTFAQEFLGATNFKEALVLVKAAGNTEVTQAWSHRLSILEQVFNCYRRVSESAELHLSSRGYKTVFDRYPVGYAPNQHYLQSQGFSWEDLESCGVVTNYKGIELYRNRSIFCIKDRYGRPVHLQGRSIDPDDSLKWLSTKGNDPINHYVYNLDKLAEWKKEFGYVFLCEGLTDCYSLLEMGIPACATFGVQNQSFSKYYECFADIDIVAIFDNDRFDIGNVYSGQPKSWLAVMPELIKLASLHNRTVACVTPPNKSGVKDVNDLANYFNWDRSRFLDYANKHCISLVDKAFDLYSKMEGFDLHLISSVKASGKEEDKEKLRSYISQKGDWLEFILNEINN